MSKLGVILFLCLFIISSCGISYKTISYTYSHEIDSALSLGMAKIDSLYGHKMKYFALLKIQNSGDESIILSPYRKINPGIYSLVKNSNRKIFLSNKIKVPILFLFDMNASLFKKTGLNYFPYGGYAITTNSLGQIVYMGYVL